MSADGLFCALLLFLFYIHAYADIRAVGIEREGIYVRDTLHDIEALSEGHVNLRRFLPQILRDLALA